MTFGSFIGFSMALPLSITVIFGFSHVPDAAGVMQHTLKNPNAPSALTYAWIGPFVGALIRPVGGWISDKWRRLDRHAGDLGGDGRRFRRGGLHDAAGVQVGRSRSSISSAFMLLFVLLFAATGIGNGSTFRTIGVIFDRSRPARCWDGRRQWPPMARSSRRW